MPHSDRGLTPDKKGLGRLLFWLPFAAVSACSGPNDNNKLSSRPDDLAAAIFSDVADSTGLKFSHETGAKGNLYFPEIVGAGGAMLDYDNDGDLDVYLIQSGALRGFSKSQGNRLFQNQLNPAGALSFLDVTEAAGVGDRGYGMGVTVGDIDNDGDPDIYVTNFGDNVLYRNNGRGSFDNITEQAGVNDQRWSTSAAFVDVDHDGYLDLFVTTYADYQLDRNVVCRDSAGRQDYCAPNQYPPTPDVLFRNLGGGKFSDISESSRISSSTGPGLGVVGEDFDGDGLTDIFVANDQQANFLWRNQGGGIFEETGLMTGVAFNSDGKAEASMGVTVGDFDSDGDNDLFMTHLTTESNTLYVNNGSGIFTDVSTRSGLGAASVRYTGFGSQWFDFDNDGDLDLFVANGAVFMENLQLGDVEYPYAQPDQLFENLGDGRFRDISEAAGFYAMVPLVGRGAAFGDIDNDGDIDILETNNNGPVRLLRNNFESTGAFFRIVLTGVLSNKDAQGARVALLLADGSQLWRRVHVDGSFASASDKSVHFGLGQGTEVEGVGVIWPGGNRERWPFDGSESSISLRESSGEPWPSQ